MGRPIGAKDRVPRSAKMLTPRERSALAMTASELVQATVAPEIKSILDKLVQNAREGDVQSAALLLKHAAPALPRLVARGLEDIAYLPVDQRVALIAQRTAAGQIDVQTASAMTVMAKAELETRVLTPIKAALAALRAGEAVTEVLQRLAMAVDELPTLDAIEPVTVVDEYDDLV